MKEILKKIIVLILLIIFVIITINIPFGNSTIKLTGGFYGTYPRWMFEFFIAISMIVCVVERFHKNKITKINILGVLILVIYSIFNYRMYAYHIEIIGSFKHMSRWILMLISLGCIYDREVKDYFKAVKELREENRKRKNDEDTKV